MASTTPQWTSPSSTTTLSLENGNPGATATKHEQDEAQVLEASRAADSEAPDGGYGWVVVLGGAWLMWWSSGTTYSWGVMQRRLVEDGLAGPAVLSFVGSTQAAMVSVFAVLDAWLIRRYLGARVAGMLGITIMGVAAILASFITKNRAGLFVTFGFMAGAGASFGFAVVAAVPAQYFSSKRGLANGLIFAGSGFGGAMNNFIIDLLIRKAGPPMAFRVLGLVTLATGLPAAWLMKERTKIPSRQFIEWPLFRTINFTFLWLAAAIGNFPIFVPPFFLPLYTKTLGLSSSAGAGLVAGFALSSAMGRIFCGFCCDRFGPVNVLLASLVLSAISMLAIWPISQSVGPLAVFVILNGVSNGGFFSTTPTVASSVFGSARVSVVMGMIMTGWIGGYLLGAPIAGYLLEACGGADGGLEAYRPAMFYAGGMALLSAGFLLVVKLRINRKFLAAV